MNDELLAKEMLRGLEVKSEESSEATTHKKRPSYAPLFDNIAGWLTVAVIFLLPFLAIPFASIPLDLVKKVTVVTLVTLAFLFWLAARLEDGIFSFPKSPILLGIKLVALTALVSSIASGMFGVTFWGIGTETGTTSSIFVFVALLLLCTLYFQSKKRLVIVTKAFLLSFVILAVIELIRLFPSFQGGFPYIMFGHGSTIFGLLPNSTDNLLGKWNDLGTFFALGVVACMSMLELLDTHVPRTPLYIAGAVGMLLMFLVNFNVVWMVLAIISFALLVYKLSVKKSHMPSIAAGIYITEVIYALLSYWAATSGKIGFGSWGYQAPNWLLVSICIVAALAVLYRARVANILASPALYVSIISIACFALYTPIGNYLNANQISSLEVRPAWGSTFEVVGKTLAAHPVTGSGPNTFSSNWLLYKPTGVNDTVFWNTDFNAGVGYIPTFIATTGILGLLAWLVFFGSYLYFGVRALFKLSGDHLTHGVLSVSFLSSLFLWIMATVYVPDIVVLSLAFVATGVFVGSLATTKSSSDFTIEFFNNPRFSFASVLGIVILMLLSVLFLFVSSRKYVALADFQAALLANNARGDIPAATKLLQSAAALDGTDVFYRSLADLQVLLMSRLINTTNAKPEEVQAQFKAALDTALAAGEKAVKSNPGNYQNHLSFGRVYEVMVPFKTVGAYERALAEYQAALEMNPHSPQIYLTIARLELAKGDKTKAREMISKSLTEKSNYAAAIFLLSQIEADAGNLTAAIKNAEQASVLAPQDIGVFFQLGFLKYLKKDYRGAIQALATAVQINSSYSNAKYFLGLSLDKIGETKEALKQFKEIAVTNPDNNEVKRIIANLEAGRDALANVSEKAPEKAATPPLKQTN